MFAENFSRIIAPRAIRLGVPPHLAAQLCSVRGEFENERRAIAYCMAYAWNHFASFKTAIRSLDVRAHELPRSPLIVDIGCGPGTAFIALGEWLLEARGMCSDVRYIGIDRSEHMRNIAAKFSSDTSLFRPFDAVLIASCEDLTKNVVVAQTAGRDGIVVTLSYVLHQDFMVDGQAFRQVVQALSGSRLPIWVLAQDANLPQIDEKNIEVWPETRLRAMLDPVESFGYRARFWARRFESSVFQLDAVGNATLLPATGHQGTKAIAVRLDPA